MESQSKNSTFIESLTNLKLVLYTVLEYLAPQDLTNLYMSVKRTGNSNQQILESILEAYIHIRLHLNNTDRSFYYMAYSNRRFLEIEKLNIAYAVQSNNRFKQLFMQRQDNVKLLTSILMQSGCQQIAHQIVRFADDPEIPMLKLLRQNVGLGCNSTFSNFLLSLREDLFAMDIEEYPNLSEFYQKRTNETYINQFFQIGNLRGKHKDFFKVERLRLGAYLINLEDKSEHFIQNNEMHNFIVILFCFAEQMVQAMAEYLKGIEDPFYRLLQFCLRYSFYRNFVLCIQEKFGFVFENYSNLYEDYIDKSSINMPQFSFWRPAMSKWYKTMHRYHEELARTRQNYIIEKRYKNIEQKIQNLQQINRSQEYSVVRNYIKSNRIQICKDIGINLQHCTQIFETIQEDIEFCAAQFTDYLMDISVNQVSVHWCGYTKQILGQPYQQYEKKTLELNNKFLYQITKKISDPKLILTVLNTDLCYITKNLYYKHKTIFLMEQQCWSLLKQVSNNNSKLTLSEFGTCLDQRISLYNEHQNNPKEVSPSQLPYYQIVPIPADQIIRYIEKHSISTLECTEGSVEGFVLYHSDNQEDNQNIGGQEDSMQKDIEFSQSIHADNMHQFMEDESMENNFSNSQSKVNTSASNLIL